MTGPSQGLGLDLELGVREPGGRDLDARGRLTALGAVFAEAELHRRVSGAPLAALQALDAFAAPAAFAFGHNIYWHDLPWLAAHAPDLALLQKPAVDTLVLSALAFAEHPYHALLKDYKLVRDARNDPVGDARIAGQILTDASHRLRELSQANPLFGRVLRGLTPLAIVR